MPAPTTFGTEHETAKLARKTYEKFINGDSISDRELLNAVPFFKQLADNLTYMGPVFHLAANEAHRVYAKLFDFKVARGLVA
jgi:hypothetical protein